MAATKSQSRSSSKKSSSSARARGSSARGGSAPRKRAGSASSRSSRSGGGGTSRRSGSSSSVSGSSKVTTNHDEIRKWAESRGGRPACVRGTERRGGSCLLRIDFPGGAGPDELEQMDWEEFFEQFDKNNLQFLYQQKTKNGRNSRFNKFISASTAGAKNSRSRGRGRDAR